jgi:hypothetical protein
VQRQEVGRLAQCSFFITGELPVVLPRLARQGDDVSAFILRRKQYSLDNQSLIEYLKLDRHQWAATYVRCCYKFVPVGLDWREASVWSSYLAWLDSQFLRTKVQHLQAQVRCVYRFWWHWHR